MQNALLPPRAPPPSPVSTRIPDWEGVDVETLENHNSCRNLEEGGGGHRRVTSASLQAALPWTKKRQSFVSLCPLLTRLSIVPYLGRGPPPLTAALDLDMPAEAVEGEEAEYAPETAATLCGLRCACASGTECR